jgi:hypothetical protein
MNAEKVLKGLPERAVKALVAALDQGDKWGYRCFSSIDPNEIMATVGGRYVRWKDLADKGFLRPLGGEVARLARDGPKKRVAEL